MLVFKNFIPLLEVSFFTSILILFFLIRILKFTYIETHKWKYIFFSSLILLLPLDLINVPLSLPLSGYVLGVVSNLSISTLLILILSIAPISQLKIPTNFYLAISFLGTLFYPLSLGFTMFDPYALGYGNKFFFYFLITLCLVLFLCRQYACSLIISLAVIFWSFNLNESTNLWDYLIDPFLYFYSTFVSLKLVFSRLKVYWLKRRFS
jgi:hypothetical protein